MIYGFRNLRFPVSIRRQSVKIRRSGITIRKLGTAFGFSLAVSLQCIVLPTQFETVRRFAVEQTCEIPLNRVFFFAPTATQRPSIIWSIRAESALNIHPFGQGNQRFSAFVCAVSVAMHPAAVTMQIAKCFSSSYLILNLKTMRQNTKAALTPIPICFQKTLYLCKYSTRYRNLERY